MSVIIKVIDLHISIIIIPFIMYKFICTFTNLCYNICICLTTRLEWWLYVFHLVLLVFSLKRRRWWYWMIEVLLFGTILLIVIRVILKYNRNFSFRLKIKIIGLDIEIKTNEKGTTQP